MRYVNFCVKKPCKNNAKIARFHWSRKSRDSCPTSSDIVKKSESITPETYDKLYPTGSRIGILYGLPKIHKNNVPLRPILSCINNYSYKVAKFFIPLLNPLSVGSYMVRDFFFLLFRICLISTSTPAVWSWLTLMWLPCLQTFLSTKLLTWFLTVYLQMLSAFMVLPDVNLGNYFASLLKLSFSF